LTACCEVHPKEQEAAIREGAAMLRGLGELRRRVKTWLVFNKHINVMVLIPLATFKASADVSAAMAMIADTLHLKDKGYRAVAGLCKQVITDWLLSKKMKAAAMAAVGNKAKKPRMEGQLVAGSGSGGGQAGGSTWPEEQPAGYEEPESKPAGSEKEIS